MWTDERVDLLKRLWAEGLSASQIATRLGEVTRNAVIGKVHRLGLSGRGTPSRAAQHSRPRSKPVAPAQTAKITQFPTAGATALQAEPQAMPELAPAPKPKSMLSVATSSHDKVNILQLSDKTCRWPVGEPGTESFHFCGCAPKSGLPYCERHAQVAYQPVMDRRRIKVRGAA